MMTEGQYRALVAYLNCWPAWSSGKYKLDDGMKDIGITADRSEVIEALAKAGHEYDETTGVLTYDVDDEEYTARVME